MLKNGLKKNKPLCWTTSSHEESLELGAEISKLLKPGTTLCLKGDLGAGKTTLSKGIIHALTCVSREEILSPTYSYVRTYTEGQSKLHHFDCYRIHSDDEFLELGLDDLLFDSAIKIIEWPEHISSLLPKERLELSIEYTGEGSRSIELNGVN